MGFWHRDIIEDLLSLIQTETAHQEQKTVGYNIPPEISMRTKHCDLTGLAGKFFPTPEIIVWLIRSDLKQSPE